ncbi:copper amine oxidase-like protein [Paenibacillus sp. J31TS4]|uniref:stalk domain-containing protein n=1 Tax=Paenibacillus sp. J31TS4 TaxID=2807195 RepID=UPI001B1B9CDA|nr:stalk domain-containing protein [Paenibacillus sp. J31TS4]GIP41229.1 copper amine oxidase-like protein [Paenibacillus sp. J31TS4]
MRQPTTKNPHPTFRGTRALSLVLAASLALASLPSPASADSWWDLEVRANKAADSGRPAEAAPSWARLVDHYATQGTVGGWTNAALYAKRLGQYYESVRDYTQAVRYYELENDYWLKAGKDWGAQDWARAQELRPVLDLYVSTDDADAIRRAAAPKQVPLAKFEPESGLYLGLYSEQDPDMGNNFNLSSKLYGKQHAIYLAYSPYAGDFPKRYADNVKKAGKNIALQIALEPANGLDEVKDDAHLRKWARDAKATGIPIFLRFASEMNGSWVVWHGDPQKYIEKFRLLAKVMKEEAPNVAMVWSPGDVPRYSMAAYYPGDDAVDWVGLNMYTMPYGDGQPSLPQFGTSPIERLDEVYKLYADRKPIMLSETGIAHKTNRDGKSHSSWAVANLDRLYEVLPKKYPRVKAITYFNVNMTTRESLNDYSLRDDPAMMAAYRSIIAQPFYLDQVATGVKPATAAGYAKGEGSASFRKQVRIVPYIRIPEVDIGQVDYVLNGSVVKSQKAAPYFVQLDAASVPPGSRLEVRIYNRAGQQAIAKTLSLSSEVTVAVDGKELRPEVPAYIRNGSTLVPMRAIFEALGAEVTWDQATLTATGRKDGTVIRFRIGDRTVEKNGKPVVLEAAAELVAGSTMAPARFVGEAFGGKVDWDNPSRTVLVTTAGGSRQAAAWTEPAAGSAQAVTTAEAEPTASGSGGEAKRPGFFAGLLGFLVRLFS